MILNKFWLIINLCYVKYVLKSLLKTSTKKIFSYLPQTEVSCFPQQLSYAYATQTIILRTQFLDSEDVLHLAFLFLLTQNFEHFSAGLGFGMLQDAVLLPGHMSAWDVTETE